MKCPDILETTLRDGSYTIDFNFDAAITRKLGTALEQSGFTIIEIGHGVGLNATQKVARSAATDEEYLKAGAESFKDALWGMFFIPGIADMTHLELAHRYGMKMVRIGTDITRYKEAEPFIKRANQMGMVTTHNLMKSYAVDTEEFFRIANETASWGPNIVYLVDSAGGMFPDEVAKLIRRMKKELPCKVGFHGHDNLGMANANTLAAVDAGVDIIDTSLRGMGRSAGNAQTETMLLVLKKRGFDIPIDITKVMDLGEEYINQYVEEPRGVSPIDAVSGYAEFHSSFFKKVKEAADKNRVDVRDLIIEACKIDKVNVTDEVIDEALKRMRSQ